MSSAYLWSWVSKDFRQFLFQFFVVWKREAAKEQKQKLWPNFEWNDLQIIQMSEFQLIEKKVSFPFQVIKVIWKWSNIKSFPEWQKIWTWKFSAVQIFYFWLLKKAKAFPLGKDSFQLGQFKLNICHIDSIKSRTWSVTWIYAEIVSIQFKKVLLSI